MVVGQEVDSKGYIFSFKREENGGNSYSYDYSGVFRSEIRNEVR